jgi:hypothetical protein
LSDFQWKADVFSQLLEYLQFDSMNRLDTVPQWMHTWLNQQGQSALSITNSDNG